MTNSILPPRNSLGSVPDHLGLKSSSTWIVIEHHHLRAHPLYQTRKLSGEKPPKACPRHDLQVTRGKEESTSF